MPLPNVSAASPALLVVLALLLLADAMPLPPFSWDTLPVYVHTCNMSGPFNPEALDALARYPLVTVEKGMAVNANPPYLASAEARILDALASVKRRNSSVFTVFYYNSVLSWDMYRLGETLEEEPSLWLRNRTGGAVRIPGDPSFPQPADGLLVFDFTNPTVLSLWESECLNLTATGLVDGCFADRANNVSAASAGWPSTLPAGRADEWNDSHFAALRTVQAGITAQKGGGGVVIANNFLVDGVGATMLETFGADETYILKLQQAASFTPRLGLIQAHAGYLKDGSDSYCENITNSLAVFLVAAEEGCRYHCSRGWASDPLYPSPGHDNDEWLTWRPEYSRPLGAPTGPATKTGGVYTRTFASGTRVEFDTATNTGTIAWADGHVQRG